jgi:hypothetical protein
MGAALLPAVIVGNHHSVDEERCRLILDSGGIIMATIRNPYDLLVSWYFHYKQRRGTKAPDMESFKTWLPQQLAHPNEYIRKGLFYGLPWVNRVIRFEKLQDDFNAVLEEIGLEPITIGQFNVSRFREGQSYQEMYDSELIGLVVSHFGEVLAEHGYSY